jgi:hypothetical protein
MKLERESTEDAYFNRQPDLHPGGLPPLRIFSYLAYAMLGILYKTLGTAIHLAQGLFPALTNSSFRGSKIP